MPPIQARLLKARYSEYNLNIPNSGIIRNKMGFKKPFPNISTELIKDILNVLINPPVKDKWYKDNHYHIVKDFVEQSSPKGKRRVINLRIIKPIMYFFRYPDEYYNNYEIFSIPLIHHILCGMRRSTILHRIKTGELPKNTRSDHICSNGNYPFVKPMTNKCSVAMGHKLLYVLENAGYDLESTKY